MRYFPARLSQLPHLSCLLILATSLRAEDPAIPVPDFRQSVVTPETNRKASVDAAKFIDAAKPDCGIQDAIDALPPQGGEVVLPAGKFLVRKGLVLRSGVCLRGQGEKTQLAQAEPLVQTKLTEPIREGDTTLTVEDASRFAPGMEICVSPYRGQMITFFNPVNGDSRELCKPYLRIFVEAVKDNQITISSPLPAHMKTIEAGNIVANFFPIFYAMKATDMEIRDLEIAGGMVDPDAPKEDFPLNGDYAASAITFYYVDRTKICRVTIRGWMGDGFSLQGGNNNMLTECQARNMIGHETKGFHPGSVQNECIISRCLADHCQGPGIFFCREVKFSVIGNSILTNNGEMIGGFSDFYDVNNVCNRNYGENNKRGVWFGEGSDHVFVGNTLVDTAASPIGFIGDTGGKKEWSPNWWPRRHVVVGNTIVNRGETANLAPLILIRPKTSASVIADNVYQSADEAKAIQDESPDFNVVTDNHPLKGDYAKPVVPLASPALSEIAVDAAPFYDPEKPDCGFQAAIDKAQNGGGRVQLPAGIYAMTQGLTLPSGVTLCGAGAATVLLWQGTGPVITSNEQSQIAVRRLSIRQPSENSQPAQGIAITNGSDVLIDSVMIDDLKGPGLLLAGIKTTLVSQTMISGCETGFVCDGPETLTIAESWSLRNQGDGIQIAKGKGEIVIDSSIISGNRGYGIAVQKSAGGQFSLISSVVTESLKSGVFLNDCPAGIVRGNIVHRGRISELEKYPPAAAIVLAGTTQNIQITANLVGESKRKGTEVAVEEQGGADHNTIQFNVLCLGDDTKGDVLSLSGKNTAVKDNVLKPSPFRYVPE